MLVHVSYFLNHFQIWAGLRQINLPIQGFFVSSLLKHGMALLTTAYLETEFDRNPQNSFFVICYLFFFSLPCVQLFRKSASRKVGGHYGSSAIGSSFLHWTSFILQSCTFCTFNVAFSFFFVLHTSMQKKK